MALYSWGYERIFSKIRSELPNYNYFTICWHNFMGNLFGTISWEIYLVLSHGKIYMALSHGKSIWHNFMGNLFGIISWKIYLALSHSWEYERSLPSDEMGLSR